MSEITTEELREEVPCGTCITTTTKAADGTILRQDVCVIVDPAKTNFVIGGKIGPQ